MSLVAHRSNAHCAVWYVQQDSDGEGPEEGDSDTEMGRERGVCRQKDENDATSVGVKNSTKA